MIKKILIANRGEIALRILRTCKEMGIESVAIYSSADKESLHVQLANQSICIGGPHSSESYLNQEAIIQAALLTNCQAIHPGFGFLSENAEFAQKVQDHNLIFIGPSSSIIKNMGNKIKARETMKNAGVKILPGSDGVLNSVDEVRKITDKIGLPIILKAAAGGGGRGMRIVRELGELEKAFKACQQEAHDYFGDSSIYCEKLFENVKHIEVQIVADKHGHIIHLFDRDCSMQRRNQKLIEEASCYVLDHKTRQNILDDAIKAAKAVQYDNVGTIEFLLDADNNYYFMEMNTRLQVEHPITEMITNQDIVKHQIRSAFNLPLSFKQSDISINGYAFECRINAEDIYQQFRPTAGKIKFLNLPQGKGLRLEGAIYNGYTVSPFYDSMLLKIITYGQTRLQCIKTMRIALEELIIDGVKSNEEFHYFVLHHPKFVEGKYDTSFVDEFIKELKNPDEFI